MMATDQESSIPRMKTRSSATKTLTDGDIPGIIQVELSKYLKSEEFGNIVKTSLHNIMVAIVNEAINALKEKIARLEDQLEEVREKSNDNEQYSWQSNIRIFGLKTPETTSGSTEVVEDCVKTVVDFCKEELNIDVNYGKIDRAIVFDGKMEIDPGL